MDDLCGMEWNGLKQAPVDLCEPAFIMKLCGRFCPSASGLQRKQGDSHEQFKPTQRRRFRTLG